MLAALVVVSLPATANHPQSVPGANVTFDHLKGNEWWVEVKVTASAPVDAVDARVAGRYAGAFTTSSPIDGRLRLNDWGNWVGSFHIPAGSRVEFLAYQNGGMSAVWQGASCPFTHPAGVEQCATSSSSSSTTSSGSFSAPFTGFRGNEWWVQAKVGTNGPAIAKVDVRIAPDGAWKPLTKQSWNTAPASWAGSYHFPQGSVLQMRATATTGATDLSSCRQWIPPSGQDAAVVACPGGGGSSSSSSSSGPRPFDATFTGVKGNHWWIQAGVSGNQPIAKVEARLDCEPEAWFPLANHGWGWATSIEVFQGQRVDFRATSSTGATDLSGGYTWTAATPAPACPTTPMPDPPGFVAKYTNPRGTRFHVEIDVTANQPVAAVDARTMNTVQWHTLSKAAGNTWTGDFDVTGHNVLEFRATAADGTRHVSYQGWMWTYPGHTEAPHQYPPFEPGDDVYFAAIRGDADEVWVDTYSVYPLDYVQLSYDLGGDAPATWHRMAMDEFSGDWYLPGLSIPYGSRVHFEAYYTKPTGATGSVREPGGEGPWPPWPQINSFYEYREEGTSSGTDDETGVHYDSRSVSTIRATTPDGWYANWQGSCTVVTHSFVTPPGQPGHWENTTETYEFDREPQGGWADAEVGWTSHLRRPSTCAQMTDDIPVCARQPHTTVMREDEGSPMTVDAVKGCRSSASGIEEFWWDQRIGILLDWHTTLVPTNEHSDWRSESVGWLVDTDAPLTVP